MNHRTARSMPSLMLLALAFTTVNATELFPDTPPAVHTNPFVNTTPNRWFVELSSAPTVDGGSLTTTTAEKKALRNAIKLNKLAVTELAAYDALFNGVVLSASSAEIARVRRLSGVVAIYPVQKYSVPQTSTQATPELFYALAQTGVDIAQSERGLTGAGVKVGIIDTGVNYLHPDLGGCFGVGCKVAFGKDFVGDLYNDDASSATYSPIPQPDADPMDCNGHGSHVAGIIGASGVVNIDGRFVKGVAPAATLGVYKVFGCDGSSSSDVILSAMEQALTDGVQVLNMSLGDSFEWPRFPTAAAAKRLVGKGVVVVASNGNAGIDGLYAGSAPAVADKTIAVAAFNNFRPVVGEPGIALTGIKDPVPFQQAEGAPRVQLNSDDEFARLKGNEGCNRRGSRTPDVEGKVVLVKRGGACSFYEKARNLQEAGAKAVVIANNKPGKLINVSVGRNRSGPDAANNNDADIVIPVVTIEKNQGSTVEARILSLTEARILSGTEARILTDAEARILSDMEGRILADAQGRILTYAEGRILLSDTEGRILSDAEGRILSDAMARILSDQLSFALGRILSDPEARILTLADGRILTDADGRILSDTEARILTDQMGRILVSLAGRTLSHVDGASVDALYDRYLAAEFEMASAGIPLSEAAFATMLKWLIESFMYVDVEVVADVFKLRWTMRWVDANIPSAELEAGLVSGFSSYGVSPELALKPDIGAPGGNILSTFANTPNAARLGPVNQEQPYAILSGTSMAAPHVSGAVALLLQARPLTLAEEVAPRLSNSADPKPWWGNPTQTEMTHRQGAGMLDIDNAIEADTLITPAKLSLGESQFGPVTRQLTIKNEALVPQTYSLSARATATTGPDTDALQFFTSTDSVSFAQRVVVDGVVLSQAINGPITVAPLSSVTIDVTVAADSSLFDGSLHSGYIEISGANNSRFTVPYVGYKGDYQQRAVLTPTSKGLPWMGKLSAEGYLKVNEGDDSSFSMASSDVPYFLLHFDHQPRRVRMDVVEALSGKSWHRALDLEYLPRHASSEGFTAYAWDGKTTSGNKLYTVPNGRYRINLSVLKALGDETNPQHWETWVSPIIVINR